MDLPDKTQGKSWEGAEVVDRDGERLGTCVGVFADIETDLTEWLQVDVAGHRPTFVPALDATEIGERVQVRFAKAQVLSAPQIGEDVELSQREEEQLYSHYGVAATTSESDSVLPVDVDAAAPAASGAGTAPRPAMDADASTTTAPRLRRVPRADTAPPAPVPAQTTAGAPTQSSGASAAAPLAGIAGLVLGVWFLLRGLERRAQRRRRPALKGDRIRQQVGSGAAMAAQQAGKQWAATADTRKKVAGAASSASDAAARQGRVASGTLAAASAAAAKAASKAGSDVSSSVDDASKKARKARKARERKRLRRSATGRLAAASGLATKAASDAGSSASGISKKARKARKRRSTTGRLAAVSGLATKAASDAGSSASGVTDKARKARKHRSSGPLSGLTRSTRRARGQAAGSVSAAPKKAKQGNRTLGKRVRKTKRSFARTFWQLVTLGAAGGGYVMGAKAGRERYDELAVVAGNVAEHPQVRSVTESVTDPEKRSQALAAVQERLPGQGDPSEQG